MRKLVAVLACRNQGSRLYGKPLQRLSVESGVRVIDQIVNTLSGLNAVDEVVLAISEGSDNAVYREIAEERGLKFVVGDETDVLSRLILGGDAAEASDLLRVTSESPFMFFEPLEELWESHQREDVDATFVDDLVDGCGFEIIRMSALRASHERGLSKHRSELCTLYIRESADEFRINKPPVPPELVRPDLRLTVDNPEDLIVCRAVYAHLHRTAPRISVREAVGFLDTRPDLVNLIAPFTEEGYRSMYL